MDRERDKERGSATNNKPSGLSGQEHPVFRWALPPLLAAHNGLLGLDEDGVLASSAEVRKLSLLGPEDHPERPQTRQSGTAHLTLRQPSFKRLLSERKRNRTEPLTWTESPRP